MHLHTHELQETIREQAANIRLDVLDMVYRRQAGHLGGSYSAAEILACLYFHQLRIDPANPSLPDRDRFLLSKGHAAAALYSALARRGYFPVEELATWGHLGSRLQGHPDRIKTPGVEMSSGFLGHGLSIAVGMALAQRLSANRFHIYALMSDGDMQSGVAWEGALTAAKYLTSEVTVIMDFNDVQLDGPGHEIMPLEPLRDKWRSFGFSVIEIHGHNILQILDALDTALDIHSQPTVIIAHTTKGKGVDFMENTAKWHGSVPSEQQYLQARQQLTGARDE
ncbi:MAG TPA: transketolase [Spirochaetia bacterium]|nr:transketolase [Spirochaetia bacterium]